jgi:hypothetical protein
MPYTLIEQLELMHISPGRLRIRSLRLKGDDALGQKIVAELRSISGIIDSKINTTTCSIVVMHDAARVSSHAIVNFLIRHQWVDNVIPFPGKISRQRPNSGRPTKAVLSRKISSQVMKASACCLIKLLIPVLTERYLGKTAGKIIATLV